MKLLFWVRQLQLVRMLIYMCRVARHTYLDVGQLGQLFYHCFLLIFQACVQVQGVIRHGGLGGLELKGKSCIDFHAHLFQHLPQEAVRVFVDFPGSRLFHQGLKTTRSLNPSCAWVGDLVFPAFSKDERDSPDSWAHQYSREVCRTARSLGSSLCHIFRWSNHYWRGSFEDLHPKCWSWWRSANIINLYSAFYTVYVLHQCWVRN